MLDSYTITLAYTYTLYGLEEDTKVELIWSLYVVVLRALCAVVMHIECGIFF
jgi:hypothetical protein